MLVPMFEDNKNYLFICESNWNNQGFNFNWQYDDCLNCECKLDIYSNIVMCDFHTRSSTQSVFVERTWWDEKQKSKHIKIHWFDNSFLYKSWIQCYKEFYDHN